MQWRGEMDAPRADGSTDRQHHLAVQRMTGKTPPELIPPDDLSVAAEYKPYVQMLMSVHEQLAMARPSGNGGACGFTWTDIMSFSEAMQIELSPWEIQTIIAMDNRFISTVNKIMSQNTGQQ